MFGFVLSGLKEEEEEEGSTKNSLGAERHVGLGRTSSRGAEADESPLNQVEKAVTLEGDAEVEEGYLMSSIDSDLNPNRRSKRRVIARPVAVAIFRTAVVTLREFSLWIS